MCMAIGTAVGPLVYLNYGRKEDYELAATLVNLTGTVGIVRYGKVFRGVKVYLAQKVCFLTVVCLFACLFPLSFLSFVSLC